uniref:Arylsulfotransferase (ASST) n=1 Tax=Candidatus Kentrum eta TaxID=2126337 RepID=A0A450UYY6_9GAMM|nr:MAG: Arylsulfotransferase (ASST) [Candidatus Kentron sp. H]VFJ97655.1 MAG: Arylsulfotransferase (ASST) [Candidatus Kentron sp. H]VFK02919.1 MAG: Arylsulfotransferase (ASST) [Candidatus Kentron sp. H]
MRRKDCLDKIGRLVFLGYLLLSAAACGKTEQMPLGFLSGPAIEDNPNPAVPLAALLTFEADRRVEARVEIMAGDRHRVLEYGPRVPGKQRLPLVGFSAGRHHEIRVTFSDVDGDAPPVTAALEFTAPKLPADVDGFPVIRTKRLSNAPMEPGATLFNLIRRLPPTVAGMSTAQIERYNNAFGLLVALDAAGDVIWYYRGDALITDFERLANGNILFLTGDFRAVEIDLLGNTVAQWYAKRRPQGTLDGATPVDTLTFHHDIDELPNGDFLVEGTTRRRIAGFRTSDRDEGALRKAQWVMGDEVIIFRRDGEVLWRWDAFEHLDVHRIGYATFDGFWAQRGFPETIDWSHGNAVVPLDDGSILVSYRYQSAITKVDRKTGEIVWIAGEPSGWGPELRGKLLTLKGAGKWFWHQHWPTLDPAGAMLVFDNATFQARPFEKDVPPSRTRSRIVAYALDEEEMTIEETWSSVIPQDPPVASFAMGSTQYLDKTGNLLAGYGMLVSPKEGRDESWREILMRGRSRTRIREYTHEVPAAVAWELTARARENDRGLGWNLFGAKRIESFPLRGGDGL